MSGGTVRARLAGPADHAAILAIDSDDNIYGGLDYMPSMLMTYLQASNRFKVYVVEDDGTITTCVVFMIHPGTQQSAACLAARTHPNYRLKGHMGIIMITSLKEFHHLGIKEISGDAFNTVSWKKNWAKRAMQFQYKKMRTWRTFMFKCKRRQISQFVCNITMKYKHEANHTTRLSFKEALSVAEKTSVFHDVIAKDGDYFMYSYNWMAVPANTECIKLAITESDVLVTWQDGEPEQSVAKGVSFGCMLSAKCGTRMDIYYFGTGTETFLAHVAAHFEHLVARCGTDNIGMMLHFPDGLDQVKVEAELSDFLGPRFQFFVGEDPTESFIYTHPSTSYM